MNDPNRATSTTSNKTHLVLQIQTHSSENESLVLQLWKA